MGPGGLDKLSDIDDKDPRTARGFYDILGGNTLDRTVYSTIYLMYYEDRQSIHCITRIDNQLYADRYHGHSLPLPMSYDRLSSFPLFSHGMDDPLYGHY